MNGFQIGSKRLKVQHKRVGGPGLGGGGGGAEDSFSFNSMGLSHQQLSGGLRPPAVGRQGPSVLVPTHHMNTGPTMNGSDGSMPMYSPRYDMIGGNYMMPPDAGMAAAVHPHMSMGLRYYTPAPPAHVSSPVAMHMGMHMNRPGMATQMLGFQPAPMAQLPPQLQHQRHFPHPQAQQHQQMGSLHASFEAMGLQSDQGGSGAPPLAN